MPLSTTAIHRPVTTLMFFAGIVMLGVVALSNLTVDFLPAVDIPTLSVQTAYPNTSPEEVEYAITGPVESVLGTIAGVKRIRSVTREGLSIVTVSFTWGTDMDFAVLEAREKLDQVRGAFPPEAERPTILRVDPSVEPIMSVAVSSAGLRSCSGDTGLAELKEVARALVKRRIEQVDGVAQASVLGGVEREIQIDVDMATLRALGLDIGQIGDALVSANIDLTGGTIRHGLFRYSLRVLGSLATPDDICGVVVHHPGSHRPVRIGDCATVRDAHAERFGITRYNGKEVIIVQVRKAAGANTVSVSRSVHAVLGQLRQENPDLALTVIADQEEFISRSIADVEQAIITGGLLAFVVLFLFLRRVRYPLIIGLTLPVSVLATIVAMYFLRINLNVISLTGLAVGIGMLGDNAIVVVENVTRLHEAGMPLRKAALEGSREIGTAVAASTLTNIAIFLPIVLVQGVAAQLFVDMGVTMTISLLVSLLVAMTLVPMLVSREGSKHHHRPGAGGGFADLIHLDEWAARGVRRYLPWALEHRGRVLSATLGIVLLTVVMALIIPVEMAPDIDQHRFQVQLRMPRGTSLDGISQTARLVEDELKALHGIGGVLARVGLTEEHAFWNATDAAYELADLDVEVQGPRPTVALMESSRTVLRRIAGVTSGVEYAVKHRGTSLERILRPEGNDVRCLVLGKDPSTVERFMGLYGQSIRQIQGLVDVRTSLQEGSPEYHLVVNRDAAARFGLSVQAVAHQLIYLVRGNEATSLNEFDRKTTIRIQRSGKGRNDIDAILNAVIPAGGGEVPLRALVSCVETHGRAEIWREDRQRAHVLVANVAGRSLGSVVGDLEEAASQLRLPPGYEIRVGGENREIHESLRGLVIVLLLSLLLVFMILAAEYESVLYPAVILLTSPLAATGAILAMAAADQHFNVMSLVGLVIMVGAVDNDAVIMVDLITNLRREGVGVTQAIQQGVEQRLRPILMTTATTILGIVPLVFEFGTGSDLVRALTIPLVGGLIASTLFTVGAIPVVYTYVDRWATGNITACGGEDRQEMHTL